jgi:hypothetical protein
VTLTTPPEWDGPENEPVWGLYRRHETGGGDGWDEQLQGGLTRGAAEVLTGQLGCVPAARLGD